MQTWSLVVVALAAAPQTAELHLGRLHDPERIRAELSAVLSGPSLIIDDYRIYSDADKGPARGDAAWSALGENANSCALQTVELRTVVSAAGLSAPMRACFRPTALHMLETHLDDAAAAALAAQPWVAGLKTLQVKGHALTAVGVRALLARTRALEQLTVRAQRLDVDGARAVAAHAAHLVSLDLSTGVIPDAVPLGDAGVHALMAVAWPLLEELALEGAGLHEAGLLELQSATLPRLAVLKVADAALGTAALARFGRERPQIAVVIDDRASASAWSVARALARRNADATDVGVVLARDVDVRALAGVRMIGGNLQVTGDVRDLTPLRSLETVKGSVQITGTEHLRSLGALAKLAQVDGDLEIERNLALTTTTGLSGLAHVGGRVTVGSMKTGNPGLREVGFPALQSVGGSLWMRRGKGYIIPSRKGAPDVNIRVIRPFTALRHVGARYGICADEPRLCPALEPPDAGPAGGGLPTAAPPNP